MAATIHIHTPGRICLFGDHQDYLGLPVIACAFNKGITLLATPNDRSAIEIHMPDVDERRAIQLQNKVELESSRDYFVSAIRVVERYDCIPNHGYDVEIKGDLPVNAGVSSSSALVVSWIHFLLKAYGCNEEITPTLIGELAYQAEVVQFNEPGGKMDQYSCSLGGIVFLEMGAHISCTPLETSLPGMVLGNSGIKKQTLAVLSEARSKAEEAIELVKKDHSEVILKEIQVDDIEHFSANLPKSLKSYFEAAVTNHAITQEALKELKKKQLDLEYLGKLMTQHHHILRDVLKITVPTIDCMIEAALKAGAYGAKIIGSGGGGCIVALAPKGKEQAVSEAMKQAGAVVAYPIKVAKGTRLL